MLPNAIITAVGEFARGVLITIFLLQHLAKCLCFAIKFGEAFFFAIQAGMGVTNTQV